MGAPGLKDPGFVPLPLPALLDALDVLGVTFTRKSDGIALQGASLLTDELRRSAQENKAGLLEICALRAGVDRLHRLIESLREKDPPKGTREKAIQYLWQEFGKLRPFADVADQDGNAAGFTDPSDPWGGQQLAILLNDLNEVKTAGGGYPLGPLSGDPFSQGRLFNGKRLPA